MSRLARLSSCMYNSMYNHFGYDLLGLKIKCLNRSTTCIRHTFMFLYPTRNAKGN